MSTAVESKDRFRMGFVLLLALAYTVAFLAMISAVVRGLGSARKRESEE